jgi:hypothetical protein
MTDFRTFIKDKIPKNIWQPLSDARYSLLRAAQWPIATFHPLRRESVRRLTDLKNAHQGERCFIIGNGPSLKKTDLSLLEGENTFGMNRFYMLFPKLGFSTTYLISVNSLVIQQCAEEFQDLSIPVFLSWRSRRYIDSGEGMIFLHTTYTGPKFAWDARERLWEGATVTFVALQLAFHMGFDQVILIGVDHSFSSKGKPNTTVVSKGNDPNHFDPNYFGKGFRWQLPDLETSERAYRMARSAYEEDGRQVLDATIGGKLTVFPKVAYQSLFDEHIIG